MTVCVVHPQVQHAPQVAHALAEAGLLERFLGLMGADLHPRVEARLRDCMFGSADMDGLRLGLL